MSHVILLGDSIFDNVNWVNGELTVIEHVRNILEDKWQATLLAVDGSTTEGIDLQLKKMPKDASLLLVSVGGNNALQNIGRLFQPARTATDILEGFADMVTNFQTTYNHMLKKVLKLQLPTAICTIYHPFFPVPQWQKSILSALTFYNDCIIREAIKSRLPILDLRFVCTDATDFTNSIEPSALGGKKIALAISRFVCQHDFSRHTTTIYT